MATEAEERLIQAVRESTERRDSKTAQALGDIEAERFVALPNHEALLREYRENLTTMWRAQLLTIRFERVIPKALRLDPGGDMDGFNRVYAHAEATLKLPSSLEALETKCPTK